MIRETLKFIGAVLLASLIGYGVGNWIGPELRQGIKQAVTAFSPRYSIIPLNRNGAAVLDRQTGAVASCFLDDHSDSFRKLKCRQVEIQADSDSVDLPEI
jgi:hypothetical protein